MEGEGRQINRVSDTVLIRQKAGSAGAEAPAEPAFVSGTHITFLLKLINLIQLERINLLLVHMINADCFGSIVEIQNPAWKRQLFALTVRPQPDQLVALDVLTDPSVSVGNGRRGCRSFRLRGGVNLGCRLVLRRCLGRCLCRCWSGRCVLRRYRWGSS